MQLRIHWFSPLPPARSGIADYTAGLLPYLRDSAEVVLWTDQEEWNPGLERYASVRRFRSEEVTWTDLAGGSDTLNVPVYHLGNNGPLHRAIWEVSRIVPGVTVLHDTRLQHLFSHVFRDCYHDEAQYIGAMGRFYGEPGQRCAEDFWLGGCTTEEMAERFPLAAFAVENSLAAIVHSPESMELLSREGFRRALSLPFPYAASPQSPLRQPGPPYRIVICGYLGPNRRLDSFLEALAGFSGRESFRVEVYGPLWDPAYIQGIIRRRGLTDIVSLKGFLPLRQLDEVLRGAHLGVNLRFPTMGEASMSQLQLWDHGLATMVTPVGWYAHAPEGTVLYVCPDREQEDIQRILGEFLNRPEQFYHVGELGRLSLLDLHRPHQYVTQLLRWLEHTPEFGLRRTAMSVADRVGADLQQWLPRDCADLVAMRVAEEISFLLAPKRGNGSA